MKHSMSPDHESEHLLRFAQERDAIVRLAHQQQPALTSAHLLDQMHLDEALEHLRTRWRAGLDPFDLGQTAPSE